MVYGSYESLDEVEKVKAKAAENCKSSFVNLKFKKSLGTTGGEGEEQGEELIQEQEAHIIKRMMIIKD